MPLTDYASIDDVQQRRGGDDPVVSDAWTGVITAKITEISRDIDRMVARARGSIGDFTIVTSGTATARTYYGIPGGSGFLPIDDCTAVTGVTLATAPTSPPKALVLSTDYRLVRSKGVIVGLGSLIGGWPGEWPQGASAAVTACWGLMDAVSEDLREATIIEVIRSFMGDRVGNNDALGLTPFGQMTYAKAFTSKVGKFVADWTYGGASLRGN